MFKKNMFCVIVFVCGLFFTTSFCCASTPNKDAVKKREIVMKMIEKYREEYPDYRGGEYQSLALLKDELMQQIVDDKIKAYKRTYPDSGLSGQEIFDLFDRKKNTGEAPEVKYEEGEKGTLTYEEIMLLETDNDDLLEGGGSEKEYVMGKTGEFKNKYPGFDITYYDILDYFKSKILNIKVYNYSMELHKDGVVRDIRSELDKFMYRKLKVSLTGNKYKV